MTVNYIKSLATKYFIGELESRQTLLTFILEMPVLSLVLNRLEKWRRHLHDKQEYGICFKCGALFGIVILKNPDYFHKPANVTFS